MADFRVDGQGYEREPNWKRQAGQGEEDQSQVQTRGRVVTPDHVAWKGFREWWDVHVPFQELLGRYGVGIEGPSEQSPKRECRWFPMESSVPQTPREVWRCISTNLLRSTSMRNSDRALMVGAGRGLVCCLSLRPLPQSHSRIPGMSKASLATSRECPYQSDGAHLKEVKAL